jgi:hypothetical protein
MPISAFVPRQRDLVSPRLAQIWFKMRRTTLASIQNLCRRSEAPGFGSSLGHRSNRLTSGRVLET